ncbi:hypothetical protein A2W54_01060 [Candidatus Giovannonibacteria bacterium RIFCSPHIGHO2_02_43_13]|uniref:DUF5666 domain-containing protein n=1 Tax=Candidatus Giovannonibacteria bacterium RIFCSPHIGHO2_02_43_13 TaxID=1798330 RepID=A0A1F5WU20_9BACT|nr:MAG: hypothetical protein UW28_C0017G0027 [Parcubacteria group bacterium GW2011_GWA2_44_13]OGF73100.1 MAG: hypothetical protein A3E06_01160 [Candidatus Giovannonibacteria bacterium RIFCSPHIGHO2_12_FULL_44_42]OGF79123.1 MAG: hypothetical protein A2W54_01060 [Candidatus Giovannonibacteria bacterium RIFCSPHIGHO2_02_43_13]OGF88927.1 MAG: hypothetical protein A3I94_00930 [Candidatus Giovannonibacteria bacterium RIFCSPLOWO2_02_FULL_43_54]OGF97286.1 MAG: hypothetical protein A3H08_00675 [Candidatus
MKITVFFVGLVFFLYGMMAEAQAGGRHRGGYERTDWENLYYGRRPDPPVGQFYGRYDTWQGPRSYTYNLPPPHFYHGGHPGYNRVGQQIVVVNNGYGGYQAMDYRTAMVMGSFQTLSQLLAYLLSSPPAHAAPIQQNYQVPPQPVQAPAPKDWPQAKELIPEPRVAREGVYVHGDNADAVRYAKMAYRRRSIMVVGDKSTAAKEVRVELRIGDPRAIIHIEVIDLESRNRQSRDFSGSQHYTLTKDPGVNEDRKLDAIASATEDAVAEATGIKKKEKAIGAVAPGQFY